MDKQRENLLAFEKGAARIHTGTWSPSRGWGALMTGITLSRLAPRAPGLD
jgi:hypothetical protein